MAEHFNELLSSRRNLVCFLVVLFSWESFGHKTGAPDLHAVCEDFGPEHGDTAVPQTSQSPYKVTLSNNTVRGGETLRITLEAEGGNYFRGFLVAVKKEGNGKAPVGKFNIVDGDSQTFQTINCFGVVNSTVTHTDGEKKKQISLEWIAPNEDLRGLEVVYTVVHNWTTYWDSVKIPEKVTVKRNVDFRKEEALLVRKKLSAELLVKLREVYGECEDGCHGCMGIPNGCIRSFLDEKDSEDPPTCSAMVSWSVEGDRNVYRITGNPENAKGYVAVGFSEDDKMGGDSVVGCYGPEDGAVANRFKNVKGLKNYNQGHSDSQTGRLLGIHNERTAKIDGHLFCDFDQTDHSIADILDVKLRDTKYHILLAKGSSASAVGLGSHGFGPQDIGISGEKVCVTHDGILSSSSSVVLPKLQEFLLFVAGIVVLCFLRF